MSKELLLVVETVSNEKDVERGVIFEALEAAIEAASRRQFTGEPQIRIAINRMTGEYESFRCYEVLDEEEIEMPDSQLTLEQAKEIDPNAEVGGIVEEQIENIDFGRVGAHAAKQTIVQKVREAERRKVYDAYQDRAGEVVHGSLKRMDRGNWVVDLGSNIDGLIPKELSIPRDNVRIGERLRAYIDRIENETRGYQIILSRIAPELLIELFRIEVPEVGNGTIEVKGAARDPGARAKVAVHTDDPRLDPVGACIGIRGSRVQNITSELGGERVDIIVWDEDPVAFVTKAIAPAEPVDVLVDHEKKTMNLAFTEDRLPAAVGRGGQNVRLASELTGWRLNIMSEEEFAAQSEDATAAAQEKIIEQLDIDEDLARLLASEGYRTVEDIAFAEESDLLAIEEFDEDLVEALQERANDVLLTAALIAEEAIETGEQNLLGTLPGMTQDWLSALQIRELYTWDDLAELAVDELCDMIDGIDEAQASELILAARAPWFADEDA